MKTTTMPRGIVEPKQAEITMQSGFEDLRSQLDILNDQLIAILAERFKVTQKIGEYKRDHNLPPVDPSREAAILKHAADKAQKAGLDPDFAVKIMQLVMAEAAKNHQVLQEKR